MLNIEKYRDELIKMGIIEDGKVYAWVNGGTSWTRTNDAVRAWEFAKLAESEE